MMRILASEIRFLSFEGFVDTCPYSALFLRRVPCPTFKIDGTCQRLWVWVHTNDAREAYCARSRSAKKNINNLGENDLSCNTKNKYLKKIQQNGASIFFNVENQGIWILR